MSAAPKEPSRETIVSSVASLYSRSLIVSLEQGFEFGNKKRQVDA
jgi:hypothetical protein